MDAKAKQLSDAIDIANENLSNARKAYRDYIISQSPYQIGAIITFGRENTEGKVIGHETWCGECRPRVVTKKKDGQWSTREAPIYRIDNIKIVQVAQ